MIKNEFKWCGCGCYFVPDWMNSFSIGKTYTGCLLLVALSVTVKINPNNYCLQETFMKHFLMQQFLNSELVVWWKYYINKYFHYNAVQFHK